MLKVKKGLILFTSLGIAATLTACNDSDESKEAHKTGNAKTEHKHSNSDNHSSDKAANKKNTNTDNISKLSTKKKLALAFFADDIDQYIITKDEALTGIYESKTGGKSQKKQLYKLLLIKEKNVANAPKGMTFYSVYPPKGSFASVIGISDKKIYVGGTQGALDYKEMADTGNEYNVKDLYNKNKAYSSLTELAKKIKITNKNPMSDDKTSKEFEANESLNTNSHLRKQVYQMIEELDGHPINKDKYLVDNVKVNNDGKWHVNYRNKNAEIVGTYTTQGKKVIKKDKNGKIIKSKQIDPNKYY